MKQEAQLLVRQLALLAKKNSTKIFGTTAQLGKEFHALTPVSVE